MNFKTTLFLLVLIAVIGGFFVFSPKPKSGAEIDADSKPTPNDYQPLFENPLTETDLKSFTLERPGKPKLAFERAKPEGAEQAEWRMTEPLAGPSETFVVSSLVGTFTSLQYRFAFDPSKLSDKDSGLDAPLATVTLVDKNDKTIKVLVGGKAAMGSETYVRLEGKKETFAVNRELAPEIKKDAADFRAKKLIAANAENITRVALEHAGKNYVFSKAADGEWVIEQPISDFADNSKFMNFLTGLVGLRAESFVEAAPLTAKSQEDAYLKLTAEAEFKKVLPPAQTQPADTQPAEPKYEITRKSYAIVFGDYADLKSEKRLARVDEQPGSAVLKQDDVAKLVPKLNELRRTSVTRVKAGDATQLDITLDGATAVLKREGGTWRGAGDLAQPETGAVADVVQAFEALTAIDFIDEPTKVEQYGLDAPRAIIKVTPGPAAPVTLKIGKDTDSKRNTYVQRDGSPTVYVVAAAQAQRLAVAPLALRSREIFSYSGDKVTELDLTRGESRYRVEREGMALKLAEPAGAPADLVAVRSLLNDLARLRAKKVVDQGNEERYGLAEPAMVMKLAIDVTPATQPATAPAEAPPPTIARHTLFIGRVGEQTFAKKDDQPWIFELDESIYRSFSVELLDAAIWSFNTAEVAGVSIVSTGGALEFNRIDSAWKYAADPYVAVTQKRVSDFLDELAKLRVERYITYRDADLSAEGFDEAPATLTLKLKDGSVKTLKLVQEVKGQLPRKAALVESKRTFRLKQADVEKMMNGLDYYLQPEPPADSKAMPPGRPGQGQPPMPPMSPGG